MVVSDAFPELPPSKNFGALKHLAVNALIAQLNEMIDCFPWLETMILEGFLPKSKSTDHVLGRLPFCESLESVMVSFSVASSNNAVEDNGWARTTTSSQDMDLFARRCPNLKELSFGEPVDHFRHKVNEDSEFWPVYVTTKTEPEELNDFFASLPCLKQFCYQLSD